MVSLVFLQVTEINCDAPFKWPFQFIIILSSHKTSKGWTWVAILASRRGSKTSAMSVLVVQLLLLLAQVCGPRPGEQSKSFS